MSFSSQWNVFKLTFFGGHSLFKLFFLSLQFLIMVFFWRQDNLAVYEMQSKRSGTAPHLLRTNWAQHDHARAAGASCRWRQIRVTMFIARRHVGYWYKTVTTHSCCARITAPFFYQYHIIISTGWFKHVLFNRWPWWVLNDKQKGMYLSSSESLRPCFVLLSSIELYQFMCYLYEKY